MKEDNQVSDDNTHTKKNNLHLHFPTRSPPISNLSSPTASNMSPPTAASNMSPPLASNMSPSPASTTKSPPVSNKRSPSNPSSSEVELVQSNIESPIKSEPSKLINPEQILMLDCPTRTHLIKSQLSAHDMVIWTENQIIASQKLDSSQLFDVNSDLVRPRNQKYLSNRSPTLNQTIPLLKDEIGPQGSPGMDTDYTNSLDSSNPSENILQFNHSHIAPQNWCNNSTKNTRFNNAYVNFPFRHSSEMFQQSTLYNYAPSHTHTSSPESTSQHLYPTIFNLAPADSMGGQDATVVANKAISEEDLNSILMEVDTHHKQTISSKVNGSKFKNNRPKIFYSVLYFRKLKGIQLFPFLTPGTQFGTQIKIIYLSYLTLLFRDPHFKIYSVLKEGWSASHLIFSSEPPQNDRPSIFLF